MNFNQIDLDHWPRKPYFEHYLHQVRCTFSITAHIDITLLRQKLKHKGIKLYPALIYMMTTVVNRHSEFRTCLDTEGQPGIWDQLSPSFTIFHDETKTFSSIWTPFSPDFQTFYNGYLEETAKHKNANQLFPATNEPANTFPISSIPWVNFTSFNLNVYTGDAYLLPIFTIGKFVCQDTKIMLPVSVQLHHAVCDGYHAGLIFNELQALADDYAF